MLRKRIVHGRPNAVTSSFSPLRPCVLNSDLKYFNLSIIHLEVTHIQKIGILAYFLPSLFSVSPTVTAGAKNDPIVYRTVWHALSLISLTSTVFTRHGQIV